MYKDLCYTLDYLFNFQKTDLNASCMSLTACVFLASCADLNRYQVNRQRPACGMPGHLPVHCRDQDVDL
jgi:hypothetical protein